MRYEEEYLNAIHFKLSREQGVRALLMANQKVKVTDLSRHIRLREYAVRRGR